MIPILIGEKKFNIKSIDELNTKEFIELAEIKELNHIKYIAWQTNQTNEDAFFAVISNTVENAIGKVSDITKIKKPKRDDIDYSKIVDLVGQRHQIETSKKVNFELIVFVLAVSQARSNNIDDVNKLYDRYLTEPFQEILPAGFFFLKILLTGKKSEIRSLKNLLSLIKIKNSREQLEFSD